MHYDLHRYVCLIGYRCNWRKVKTRHWDGPAMKVSVNDFGHRRSTVVYRDIGTRREFDHEADQGISGTMDRFG